MHKRAAVSIIVLLSLTIISIIGYFLLPIKTKHNIKLPSNDIETNLKHLNNRGYNLNFLDKLFLKTINNQIKGWLYINKTTLPRYKFLIAISSKGNHYTPVTIIPGETTHFTLKSIAKKLNLNRAILANEYKSKAKYLEGNLLADTYNIPYYFKEKETINFILNSSYKEYNKLFNKYFKKYDFKKWKKIVTIASIIEKEIANKKEMHIIASVIFNRLDKKMHLQMDGTLNYGRYSHQKITSKRIKSDRSFYNTYRFKGLPKEPICNVSKDSLLAAIKPAKTDYLYFMKWDKNSHSFSKNFKDHREKIIKRRENLKK